MTRQGRASPAAARLVCAFTECLPRASRCLGDRAAATWYGGRSRRKRHGDPGKDGVARHDDCKYAEDPAGPTASAGGVGP